jgi:hypothetical protein
VTHDGPAALAFLCIVAVSGGCSAPPASNAPHDAGAPDVATVPCSDGDPTQQRHGARCLCCHADEFGVAGSVDLDAPPVARVVVVDAVGLRYDMAPNSYGNFFRHYTLVPPIAAVEPVRDGGSLAMPWGAPHGDCNACHAPSGGAPPIHGP